MKSILKNTEENKCVNQKKDMHLTQTSESSLLRGLAVGDVLVLYFSLCEVSFHLYFSQTHLISRSYVILQAA